MLSLRMFLLACLLAFSLSGCGSARIVPPVEQIEAGMAVGEPPYHWKPKTPPENPPWYRDLLVELEEKPASLEALKQSVQPHKGAAQEAARKLLEELRDEVAKARGAGAKWSLLSLRLGAETLVRGESLPFTAELGLTKLFVRRPEIRFENVTLEQCLIRLALQADLKISTVRSTNPVLTWQRQDVSVQDALEAILGEHNFQKKITGAGAKVALQAEKHPSREEFKQAAVRLVLEYGKGLDRGIPALLIAPPGKPLGAKSEQDEPTAPEKATGKAKPAVPAPEPVEAGEKQP